MAASSGPVTGRSALPMGGSVAAGEASIGLSGATGNTLTINQTSSRAIIDWTGFSVGIGNAVQFENGSGATLNRVTGGSRSIIDGQLSATGSAYLINPSGVIIGKTGVINVGGNFVASTQDIADAAFMAGGSLTFYGASDAAVVNYGKIGALGGDVVLIASKVVNDGAISAPGGDAGLIAGYQVVIKDQADADGKFTVKVGGAGTSITNRGNIAAAAAELKAQNGNVYALAGNTAGVIKATEISGSGGDLMLTAPGGEVTVAAGAVLDASAAQTAGGTGDGGHIVVDSANTGFHGTAIAKGGKKGGNGGSVETSGNVLSINGATVDTTAVKGTTGEWLLDPYNVTITTSTSGGSLSSGTFTPSANNSTLNASTLTGALASTSVTVTTGSSGSQTGTITVSSALNWSSANTLTLNAAGAIAINAAIAAPNGGLYLSAGSQDLNNSIFSPGSISATAAVNVNTFTLGLGNWLQNSGTLPSFSAQNFSFDANNFIQSGSGSFIRVTGGDGSAGNPYQIADIYGLQGIGFAAVTMSKNYRLVNNINAGGLTDFASLGSDSSPDNFSGVLDGQNYTISNLASTGNANGMAGLFGWNFTGTVKNLTLSNVTIGSANAINAGAAVAQMGATSAGTVTNVSVVGGTVTAGQEAGGLVGRNAAGTISGSSAIGVTVSETSSSSLQARDAGGLVGQNNGTITTSYATGSVSALRQAGGLVGIENGGTISQSYATGAVSVTPGSSTASNPSMGAGGFVGVDIGGTITQSYATGAVTLTNAYNVSVPVGGFVGANGGPITEAYATGYVTIASGTGTLGGFVGANTAKNNVGTSSNGTLTNTYYDSGTTGQTGGSTTAALQGTLPSGFNTLVSGVWATGTGLYPYLASQFGVGTTPEAITGTATTSLTSGTGIAGVQVSALVGGTSVGSASTGANGYYYILSPQGTVPASSQVLTYLSSGAIKGNGFYQDAQASTSGVNIYGGSLSIFTDKTVLSQTATGLSTALGSNSGSKFLFTIAGGAIAPTSGTNVDIMGRGASFSLDKALTTTGLVYLNEPGAVTQSAALTAGSLDIEGAGASYTLTNAGNSIGTIAGQSASNGGAVSLVTTGALTIGSAGFDQGITGFSAAAITAGGAVTINQNLNGNSGVTVSATGSITIGSGASVNAGASTVSLAATGAFVNNSGSSAVSTAGGRWLIYSATSSGDTFGSLDSSNTAVWNTAAGASVSATGNRYVFAYQPTLTITTTNDSKNYGASALTQIQSDFTVSGLQPAVAGAYLADTATSVYSGAPSLSSAGSGTTATVAGGPYAINAALGTLSALNGYAFAYSNTGALTVNPIALTIMAANQTATYGTPYTLNTALTTGYTVTGLINSDTITGLTEKIPGNLTATTATTAAGGYTITPSAAAGTGLSNYTIAYNTGTLTVNPLVLSNVTYSVANASSTYGTLAVLGAATLTGVLNGDQVTGTVRAFTSGGSMVTLAANTAAGSYVEKVTGLTGTNAGNYAIATTGNTNGTLTVSPLTLTYTVANQTSTYGTLATLGAATLTGIVNGDPITGTAGAFTTGGAPVTLAANSAAGSYTEKVTGLTGTGASNYMIATTGNTNGTLVISPLAVTLSGAPSYNGTTTVSAANLTVSNLVSGDSNVSVGLGGTATLAAKNVGAENLTSLAGLTLSSGNYTLTGGSGSVAVSPATLTVAAVDQTATYGTPYTLSTGLGTGYSLTGLQGADTVTGVTLKLPGGLTATTATTAAGGYTITPSAATGTGLSNYTIAYSPGMLTVTPLVLNTSVTYSVANASSTYGTLATLGAATLTGVLNGDQVTGVVGAFASGGTPVTLAANTAAGSYVEKVTGLTGAAASNYTIATTGNTNGTLTVNPLTLTVTASNQSATYGTAYALPSAYNAAGLVNGDTVTGVTLQLPGGLTGTTATTAAGSYTITPSAATGTGLSNYTIAYNTGTLTVNPLVLSNVTYSVANASSTYGTLAVLGAATLTGVLNGDQVTGTVRAFTSGGSMVTLAANTAAGSYVEKVTGLTGTNAGNYAIATTGNTNGTLTVSPLTLTYTVANQTSTYGTLATLGAATLTGIVNGDPITGTAGAFTTGGAPVTLAANSAAGSYTEKVTGLTGTGASNYMIATTGNTNGTLVISPLAVTLSGAPSYNGTTTVSAANLTVSNLVSGDSNVSVGLGGTATLAAKNVGAENLTSLAGLTLSSGNYTLTGGSGSVAVSPATLTVAAVDQTATYGTPYTLSTGLGTGYSLTGLQGADTVTGVTLKLPGGLTATTATTAAGGYTITPSAATGTGLSNYTIAYSPGMLTVTPLVLNTSVTYSVANASSTYGTLATLGAATLTGVLNGDQVTGVVGAFASGGTPVTLAANTAAGSYVEKVTGLTGAAASNYTIATTGNTNGTLTVNPLTLTVTASNQSATYGTAYALPSAYNAAGLVNGDTVTGVTLQLPGGLTGTTATTAAGSYTITPSAATGTGLSNYAITYSVGTLTINPLILTAGLTGTVEKTYDGTNAATLTATNYKLTGVVIGDSVTLSDPSAGSYATASAGLAKIVTVTGVTLTGTAAGNYRLASSSVSGAIGIIDPRPIAAVANSETKQTGQVDPPLTYAVTAGSLVFGDVFTGSLVRQPGETLGSYTIGQGSLALSANYTLTFINGAFTILSPPVVTLPPTPANAQSANSANGPGAFTVTSVDQSSQTAVQPAGSGVTNSGGTGQTIGLQPLSAEGPSGAPYPDNQFISDDIRFAPAGSQ